MNRPEPTPEDDVRTFRDPAAAADARDAAAGRLFRVVRSAAYAAALGVGANRSDRDEFADAAPARVLYLPRAGGGRKIDQYDPGRPFLPWLNTVLRNAYRDDRKKRAAAVPSADPVELARYTARPPAAVEGRPVAALLAVVRESLGVARAVDFLSVAGWHTYLPPGDWAALLDEWERATGRAVVRPFPGPALDGLTTPRKRMSLLALALGYGGTNTLSVNFRRAHHRLTRALGRDPTADPG